MTWTRERTIRLTALWNDGYSATIIARELGGVTRSGVLGKVFRLGLGGRGPVVCVKRRKRPKTHTAPRDKPQLQSQLRNAAVLPEVRRLAEAGKTTGQIATIISEMEDEEFTISRISGLCCRNNIRLPNARGRAPRRIPRWRMNGHDIPHPDAPQPKMLSLDDLTLRTCRWPIGDPGGASFGYCGHECPFELPYCGFHMALGYRAGTAARLPPHKARKAVAA